MTATLVRMQDSAGRGPWKPGFSSQWVSDETPVVGSPIFVEPGYVNAIAKSRAKRTFLGCAVRPERIGLWFSPACIRRLATFGYRFVDASDATILLETDEQVLFETSFPLMMLPAWQERA